MFTKVSTVSLFVADQQRAKDFYVNKLGWELRSDGPLYAELPLMWITVAPPAGETEVVLYELDSNWMHYAQVVGKSQAITLASADIHATHQELVEREVTIVQAPETVQWGTFMMIEDSEGNTLIVVQDEEAE